MKVASNNHIDSQWKFHW